MTSTNEAEKSQKRRAGRSPSYPYIPVHKAIDQARALHEKEGDYAAPLTSAVAAWGYSAKSSGGRQTLATLRYYGLIDVIGDGDARKIKVSDVARRIILDQREDDSEKRKLIRAVALSPSAHKALYEQYPNGLASDASVEHFLIFERGFNADAAKELLAEFKVTASQVNLFQPADAVDITSEMRDEGNIKKEPPNIKVGDRVQVTVGGVDMFADGATVLGFSDDGAYVFTDQADSGAKIEEVTVLESAATPVVERPSIPAHLRAAQKDEEVVKPGSRKAVFPVEDGDVALIFPENISADGLKTLGAYLDIFLKKEVTKKKAATDAADDLM